MVRGLSFPIFAIIFYSHKIAGTRSPAIMVTYAIFFTENASARDTHTDMVFCIYHINSRHPVRPKLFWTYNSKNVFNAINIKRNFDNVKNVIKSIKIMQNKSLVISYFFQTNGKLYRHYRKYIIYKYRSIGIIKTIES